MSRDSTPTCLRVLNADFLVLTEDDDWRSFLRQLWAPFDSGSAEAPAREANIVSVEVERGIHRASSGGSSLEEANPWLVAEWIRQRIVETAVAQSDSIVGLHGAALVRDGSCLILAGGSGAGKTTLAIALCTAGWRLLSDDLAPIERTGGRVLAFPKPLSIKSIPRWRELAGAWAPPPWPLEPLGGLLVPATVLPLEEKPQAPTHLVFCRFEARGSSRIEEIGVAEAAAECGQLVSRLDTLTLRFLVELATRTRSARLAFSDTTSAVEAVGRFCLDG
jgi:hypothetical protein